MATTQHLLKNIVILITTISFSSFMCSMNDSLLFQFTSLVILLLQRSYLRLQQYFPQLHPRERKTRKLWNLGNYFLPSPTHLLVIILTASILFEGTVRLRELFGKSNKIRRSGASFFAMKHAIYSRCYFQGGLCRQADTQPMQIATEGVYELIQVKICWFFKIKSLKQYRKQCMGSILIKNDWFVSKSTGSGNSFGVLFHKYYHYL